MERRSWLFRFGQRSEKRYEKGRGIISVERGASQGVRKNRKCISSTPYRLLPSCNARRRRWRRQFSGHDCSAATNVGNGGDIDLAVGAPDAVLALPSAPCLGRPSEQFGKHRGEFGSDGHAFGQDFARTLPRDAEHLRNFRSGFSDFRNPPREATLPSRRTTVRLAAHCGLLAISCEFRGICIAVADFESGAPRTADRSMGLSVFSSEAHETCSPECSEYPASPRFRDLQPPKNAI